MIRQIVKLARVINVLNASKDEDLIRNSNVESAKI